MSLPPDGVCLALRPDLRSDGQRPRQPAFLPGEDGEPLSVKVWGHRPSSVHACGLCGLRPVSPPPPGGGPYTAPPGHQDRTRQQGFPGVTGDADTQRDGHVRPGRVHTPSRGPREAPAPPTPGTVPSAAVWDTAQQLQQTRTRPPRLLKTGVTGHRVPLSGPAGRGRGRGRRHPEVRSSDGGRRSVTVTGRANCPVRLRQKAAAASTDTQGPALGRGPEGPRSHRVLRPLVPDSGPSVCSLRPRPSWGSRWEPAWGGAAGDTAGTGSPSTYWPGGCSSA